MTTSRCHADAGQKQKYAQEQILHQSKPLQLKSDNRVITSAATDQINGMWNYFSGIFFQ